MIYMTHSWMQTSGKWIRGTRPCPLARPCLSRRSSSLLRAQSRFGPGGGTGGHGGSGGGGHGGWHHGSPGGSGHNPFLSRVFAGVSQDQKDQKKPKKEVIMLTMSAISVSRAAFSRITKSFVKYYREKTGYEVRFRMTYNGSGIQARAVIDGLPADIVALALPLDVIKIQQAGLIDEDWQKRAQNNSIFAESVVSIVVRKGNPHDVQDWPDLVKDDVEVITANPKTAGVARWTFLALWGHMMQKGDKKAREYVTQVFDHVPVQPRDAREASDVFYKQEVGDALLTYENEVIMTNRMVGEEDALPYVVPENNIRIEAPVALVDRNLRTKSKAAQEAAQAFVDYLFTPEAQRTLVEFGFRSVNPVVQKETEGKLPKVKTLWSVDGKLGGWIKAQDKFFAADRILDDIQTEVSQRRLEIERQKQRSRL